MSTPANPSFWSRAQQALLRMFVGRESALRSIENAWTEAASEPRIVWCCGPSGIGKTALTQVAGARIRARGGRVVFLHAGQLQDAVKTVSALGRESIPDMLILDSEGTESQHVERVFETLLPQAGEHILVLVASVEPPTARVATAFDGILRTLRLRPLSEEEAAEALARRSVALAQREDIIALAGGLPRALAELADRARTDRPTPINERSPHELAEIIALNVTRSAPSPDHRRALDALCVVPMLDAPLLHAMLTSTRTPVEDLFTWLGEHSFVVREAQGLGLHPRVRDALHRELCMRDPMQRKAMGDSAARVLMERMHTSLALGDASRFYSDAFFARREVRPPVLSALLRQARKLCVIRAADLPSAVRLKLDAPTSALLSQANSTFFGVGRSPDNLDLWVELDTREPTHITARFHAPPHAAEAPFSAAPLAGTSLVLAYAHMHRKALVYLHLPAAFEGELAPLGFSLLEETEDAALYLAELTPSAPAISVATSTSSDSISEVPSDDVQDADRLDAKTLSLALRHAFAARFEPHTLRRSTLLSLDTVQRAGGDEEALAAILDALCTSLAASPAYVSSARLLQVTYLDPSKPKQEAAAVDLGLPFGTYRYQLRRALDLATQDLMHRERAARSG
jgi:hypothetical protein